MLRERFSLGNEGSFSFDSFPNGKVPVIPPFLEWILPFFYLDSKIREKNLIPERRKWLIPQMENLQKESGGIIHDIQSGRFQ
ncbi:hypothetical protein LEP1GSC052_0498 [Leptospira kmetyi serovar Malaysia str. Bejo-Iso9]|uniref:Uncharacterized protein n=1 Tax=Leptospira kmetyi TaxID=408139 RepID=A0ABX4N8H2_9LEPT|nr:hypothetical protein LEP1GSC052_0498 [Leptospira kmetyi serovar Malaysia str. Bejo-Iso9]PJZ28868.1 hypothetical protein CH378_15565 [Leptospira kmetyi]